MATTAFSRKLGMTLLGWAAAILFAFPILWMVLTSFKTETQAIARVPQFFFHPTLGSYIAVQEQAKYLRFAWNSVIVAGGSTLLALVFAIPSAYAMAFMPSKRTKSTLLWMLSTKMMPPVGVLVPVYLIFRDSGLLDTRTGLLIVDALGNLPIIIWMLYTFFKEVPREVLEAGRMDGANPVRELYHLLLPLSMPGIVSTSLLAIILAWNEAFWSLTLTTSKAAPLTAFIASFSSPQGLFYARLSAASTMAIAPIVILGWMSQKRLVRGLTFAAVKKPQRRIMAKLELHHVPKSYGATEIIKEVDLTLHDREFTVFVGPSGCGKSTLLRMIAGLEDITSGDLLLDGKRINDVPPAKRGLALVFQSYALYPHMDVAQNMSFSLKLAGVPKAERQRKVMEAARILHLEALLDRKPKELSGGQRQRVAIGRAIVRNPTVFLFDEPLSNLDAALRVRMRLELVKLHRELHATTVYVTHDQVEAMTMADRIVVLQAGVIEQVGTPMDLYRHPRNLFVAGFLGSPKMNLLRAVVQSAEPSGLVLAFEGATFQALAIDPASRQGDLVTLGIRPEHVSLIPAGGFAAKVQAAEHLGGETHLHLLLSSGETLTMKVSGETTAVPDDEVHFGFAPAHIHVFDMAGDAMLHVAPAFIKEEKA